MILLNGTPRVKDGSEKIKEIQRNTGYGESRISGLVIAVVKERYINLGFLGGVKGVKMKKMLNMDLNTSRALNRRRKR